MYKMFKVTAVKNVQTSAKNYVYLMKNNKLVFRIKMIAIQKKIDAKNICYKHS